LKPLSTDRTQVAARRYTYEIAITHQFLEKGAFRNECTILKKSLYKLFVNSSHSLYFLFHGCFPRFGLCTKLIEFQL